MTIAPPKVCEDQLDRARQCREALRTSFEGLASEAVGAGWDQYDVALALSELGEKLVKETAENAGSEADIAIAKALLEIRKTFLISH